MSFKRPPKKLSWGFSRLLLCLFAISGWYLSIVCYMFPGGKGHNEKEESSVKTFVNKNFVAGLAENALAGANKVIKNYTFKTPFYIDGIPDSEEFNGWCQNRREMKELPRKMRILYIQGKYQLERVVLSAFNGAGFEAIKNFEDATFILSKSPGDVFGWSVCADSQKFNHIPNQEALAAKADLWSNLKEFIRKDPSYKGIMPESWRLDNMQDCQEFRAMIKEEKEAGIYKNSKEINFISKPTVGGHNGHGLRLLENKVMLNLDIIFDRQPNCEKRPRVVQRYLTKPYLVMDKYIFSMRIYLFIAHTDPFIVYYHPGYIRVPPTPYNASSNEQDDRISNKQKDWGKKSGMFGHGTDHRQFYLLKEFEKFLIEQGRVKPGWVEQYLEPRFMRAFVKIFHATREKLGKGPQWYGLFGADFTLDDDLHPWLFEVNSSPELSVFIAEGLSDKTWLRRLAEETTDIEFALVKKTHAGEKVSHEAIQSHVKEYRLLYDQISGYDFAQTKECRDEQGMEYILGKGK